VIDFLDFPDKTPIILTMPSYQAEVRLLMKSLMARYHEPHRHYHTFAHIQYGFQRYAELVGDAMRATTFMAWCYHDSVYDPHADDNEDRSAKVFMEDNKILGFAMEDTERIVDLILSTTHTGETNVVTDIDLSGLGAPLEVYQENTRRIRMEYSFATAEQWAAGRTAFLKSFIKRAEEGTLYNTREFAAAYTARALDNMKAEVENNGYFCL